MKQWWNKYWWHVVLWVSLAIAQTLADSVGYGNLGERPGLLRYSFWILVVVLGGSITVYSYGYMVSLFNWRKNGFLFLLVTLGAILIFPIWTATLRTVVDTWLFGPSPVPKGFPQKIFSQLGFWYLFWGAFARSWSFTGLGFVMAFYKDYLKTQQHQQILQKAAISAELASLKNQINPHFLYNTLNYLYSQARPVSEPLSEAILLLSEVMRYSLQADEQGLVALDKEIQHIHNFIKIHQLRFGNKLAISFVVEGNTASWRILPLVLISFVENAFKHGKTTDSTEVVRIELKATPAELQFSLRNRKLLGPKDPSSGVGLANVRRRLALVYAEKHQLDINDLGDYFEVKLTLK